MKKISVLKIISKFANELKNNGFTEAWSSTKVFLDEELKEIRDEKELAYKIDLLDDFRKQMQICYQYDHQKFFYEQYVSSFIDKVIKSEKIGANEKITTTVKYSHHFDDTWDKYSITERFHKDYLFRIDGGTLLHLAAIIGSNKMVDALLEKGAKVIKDRYGHEPKDFLFFNQNYMSKEDFDLLQKKLSDSPKNVVKIK